ncbi:MAG TPA: AraC family transcriptional regulator [Sphingobium sp.]|nr:AraC family transcriptional regulator [Sphingobium sp.]
METAMQTIVWSTAGMRGAPALRQWQAVIDRSLFALDIDSSAESFHARMEQGPLGPALMSKLIAGPQTVRRTPRCIARMGDGAKLDVIAIREGTFYYAQNGHEDVLRPGDCVLLDRAMPYRFEASESCSMTLALEHDWLARWTPDPAALAGRRIDGAHGWGRALSATLGMLEVDMADRLVLPAGALAEQIASLLVLACTPDAGPPHRDRPIVHRLRQLIADRAHDPAFDVAGAARELGVSRRYLHLLCARSGASFGTMLMAERLDRAHRLLADRRSATLPIGEVAWRCGFTDQGHFARRFRARFGTTPTAVRAAVHS